MAVNPTIREYIDSLSILELINNPEFCRLEINKGVCNAPDYWEIGFESTSRSVNGLWNTFYGQEVWDKFYKIYKLKDNVLSA